MSLVWPVVAYLSCEHFKIFPADDVPKFSALVDCEEGCGPVAVVETAGVDQVRCVHNVKLSKPCSECERDMEVAGNEGSGWRMVSGVEPSSFQPAKPVEVQVGAETVQMLEVAPGVRRTPLTGGREEQSILLRLAALAPPDAAEGVHGDVLTGQGARGAAKLALVMKDARALGLVEVTSPKGDPYLYRLTEKGAEEVERIHATEGAGVTAKQCPEVVGVHRCERIAGHDGPHRKLLGDEREPLVWTSPTREIYQDEPARARCSVCGRSTWTDESACGMPQPDGTTCQGVFVPITDAR